MPLQIINRNGTKIDPRGTPNKIFKRSLKVEPTLRISFF